jgi:hypothetical protein
MINDKIIEETTIKGAKKELNAIRNICVKVLDRWLSLEESRSLLSKDFLHLNKKYLKIPHDNDPRISIDYFDFDITIVVFGIFYTKSWEFRVPLDNRDHVHEIANMLTAELDLFYETFDA